MKNHEHYMSLALKQAKIAYEKKEVPVGCVIVYNDKVIARAYNKRETFQSGIAHAEILAIQKACKKLNSWRLEDCTLYVTLEPCIMCSGAIIQSRITNVVYGCADFRFGAHKSFINVFDYKFNHTVNILSGIKEEECSSLIKSFFKELRSKDLN